MDPAGRLFLLADMASAEAVRLGIGFAIPSCVLREQGEGLEMDPIRETFRAAGRGGESVFLSNRAGGRPVMAGQG